MTASRPKRSVARMSKATCGNQQREAPGCRFPHPGYVATEFSRKTAKLQSSDPAENAELETLFGIPGRGVAVAPPGKRSVARMSKATCGNQEGSPRMSLRSSGLRCYWFAHGFSGVGLHRNLSFHERRRNFTHQQAGQIRNDRFAAEAERSPHEQSDMRESAEGSPRMSLRSSGLRCYGASAPAFNHQTRRKTQNWKRCPEFQGVVWWWRRPASNSKSAPS